MVLLLKSLPEEFGHLRFVFHYEQAHRYVSSLSLRRVPEAFLKEVGGVSPALFDAVPIGNGIDLTKQSAPTYRAT
jgi:hypothetical protein